MATVTWIHPADGAVVGVPFTAILQTSPPGATVDIDEPSTGKLLGTGVSDPETGIVYIDILSWDGIAPRASAISVTQSKATGAAAPVSGVQSIADQLAKFVADVAAAMGARVESAGSSSHAESYADGTVPDAPLPASAAPSTSASASGDAITSTGIKVIDNDKASASHTVTTKSGQKAIVATVTSTSSLATVTTTAGVTDTVAPIVQSFALNGAASGLTQPITFTATDAAGPTLFCMKAVAANAAAPTFSVGDNWQPAAYWTTSTGLTGITVSSDIYAAAKSNDGTISAVSSKVAVTVAAPTYYCQGALPPPGGPLAYLMFRGGDPLSTLYTFTLSPAYDSESADFKVDEVGATDTMPFTPWPGQSYMRFEFATANNELRVLGSNSASGPWTLVWSMIDSSPRAVSASSSSNVTEYTSGVY